MTPSQVPADPREWSWYLIALGVGAALGWGIKAWRDKEEIRKLKAEVEKFGAEVRKLNAEEIKLAGDNLKEVQRVRDAYSDACIACGQHAKEIILLLQKNGNQDAICRQRDDYGGALSHRALPALCSLTEWQSLSRKSDTSALIAYIRSDVIPELNRINSWIAIINAAPFTEYMSLSPLTIQERTMRPFFDLLRFIPEDRHSEIKEQLFAAIQKVTGS